MSCVAGGWHKEDIKAALRKQCGSLHELSSTMGLSHSAVSRVLIRPSSSIRVERRIAEVLGVPPHEIWPDRWHADGRPMRRSNPASTRQNGARKSQKRQEG